MMARPVAHYLMNFDAEVSAGSLTDFDGMLGLVPVGGAPDQSDDLEASLAAAREEGRTEGAEAAQTEAAAHLDQVRRDFQEELAAERQRWLQEEATALKEELASAVQQMKDGLAECVARILRPFITESLRRQMIDELVEHLGSIAASHDAVGIKISGSSDLIAVLQEQLSELPIAIDYEQNDSLDVRVIADETLIETRLQAWIDLISAKME
jgi:hypothetical protein